MTLTSVAVWSKIECSQILLFWILRLREVRRAEDALSGKNREVELKVQQLDRANTEKQALDAELRHTHSLQHQPHHNHISSLVTSPITTSCSDSSLLTSRSHDVTATMTSVDVTALIDEDPCDASSHLSSATYVIDESSDEEVSNSLRIPPIFTP